MTDTAGVDPDDLRVIAQQLGREPRGVIEISYRTPDGRPAVVTVRIFNLLQQVVAYPIALGHPSGQGQELRQLEYTMPGQYEAFWDGYDQAGRQVASGIYFMQLTVNGQSMTRKMYVLK